MDEAFGGNIEYKEDAPLAIDDAAAAAAVEKPLIRQKEYIQAMTHTSRDLDKDWLMENCVDYITRHNSLLDATQLCIDIFTILRKTDANVETLLFDLLGYIDFEFISLLISKREEIVETVVAKSDNIFLSSNKKGIPHPINSQRQPQSFGTQVTVMTQEERDQMKNMKKQRKREHKALSRKFVVSSSSNAHISLSIYWQMKMIL